MRCLWEVFTENYISNFVVLCKSIPLGVAVESLYVLTGPSVPEIFGESLN